MKNYSIEKYLILKMAKLMEQWKEPYDSEDSETMKANAPLEAEYNMLKGILKDYWAGKITSYK